MRRPMILALVLAAGCVVAVVIVVRQQTPDEQSGRNARSSRATAFEKARAPGDMRPPAPAKGDGAAAALEPVEDFVLPAPSAPPPASAPAPQPAAQPPTPEELALRTAAARHALASVGADPEAELLWLQAINDPDLPADVRQDLIEDLNEDGFPDPRNITQDDLPLIISRIELIEDIAADAMDEVNAAAFQEAYKDLVNMLDRLRPAAIGE